MKRAEVHYSHAMELYRRVLEKDEGGLAPGPGRGVLQAGHWVGQPQEDGIVALQGGYAWL